MTSPAARSADRPDDMRALGERLRELADFAAAGGAAPDWIEATMKAVVTALLDREDPRRKEALALARRMAAARKSGASIGEIAENFGRHRSTVHRLLGGVSRDRETFAVSNAHQLTRRRR